MPSVRCTAANPTVSAVQGRHAAATSCFAASQKTWITKLRANPSTTPTVSLRTVNLVVQQPVKVAVLPAWLISSSASDGNAGDVPSNVTNSAVVGDKQGKEEETPDTKVNVDDAVVAKAPDGEEVDFKKISIDEALKVLKVRMSSQNVCFGLDATLSYAEWQLNLYKFARSMLRG